MKTPLFTQKHYEHMIAELRRMEVTPLADRGITKDQLDGATEFLCRVFAADNPKFKKYKFMGRVRGRPFSESLVGWLDNFSQSAAVDMGEEFGSDKASVAEQCITCISSYDPALYAELQVYQDAHGYALTLKEVMKHVRTL